ncbi:hypothetical protein JCM10207_002613 [Rhodosporidiobolus poonsookiae]
MVASPSTGPLVLIFGATGAQGGSVVQHLLESDKPYRLRAVTRDAAKSAAKKLAEEGCEVVQADVGNEADLGRVFEGVEVVFAVTDFWSHLSAARELADGKRLGDAAVKAATVKRFVWSGLEPVKEISGGKFSRVAHFDSKAAVTAYLRTLPLPLTVVQPACYFTNFSGYTPGMAPRLARGSSPSAAMEDKAVEFALPMRAGARIALIDARRDYGAFVRAAIEGAESGELLACAEEKSCEDLAREFQDVTGLPTTYRQLEADEFLAPFEKDGKGAIGSELLEMLQWFNEYGYYGPKPILPSQQAVTASRPLQTPYELETWKAWVGEQDWAWLVRGEREA